MMIDNSIWGLHSLIGSCIMIRMNFDGVEREMKGFTWKDWEIPHPSDRAFSSCGIAIAF